MGLHRWGHEVIHPEACTPGSGFSTLDQVTLVVQLFMGRWLTCSWGPLSSPEPPHRDAPSRSEVPPVGSQADPVSTETLISEELAAMTLERHDSESAEDTC